jgi:cobalt/nickel transport system permease protein
MSDRGWLAAYLLAVLTATLVHQPGWLAAALLAAFLASGRRRWPLLRRTLLAVLAFNLTVSLGYLAVALWRGDLSWTYLLRVNLRVLLLVYLGYWLVARINVLKALDFSPTLSFVVTLAAGQGQALRRLLQDFRQAFVSRNPVAPRPGDRLRHTAAQAEHLLEKSLHNASETAQAMRSRGAFDV